MKNALLITLAAAAATLVGVVAFRLSVDALAMIVGVGIGLLALIPTLALSIFMLRRSQQTQTPPAPYTQPPVVIVSGGFPQALPQPNATLYAANQQAESQRAMIPAPPAQAPRQFRLMGYETGDAVELRDDEWSAFG